MSPEELRRVGREFIDWVAGYLDSVGDLPVLPSTRPGDVLAQLPDAPPEKGESFDAILDDLDRVIVPATTHWNHPRFFGYFSISGSAPGILGELVAAALNVNAMVWKSGPAATELEQRTLDWLRRMMGLPDTFRGAINDTASTSTFYALVAAREKALPEARMAGLSAAPRGRVYASRDAHSSVAKAVAAMGFGRDGIASVPGDRSRAMDVGALREMMEADRDRGVRPVAVVSTIGTTSTAAVDPVGEVAEVAREFSAWLHVDAAYGGPAATLEAQRALFRGWEEADSIVVNPHKWLFTPIDCSVLYTRDPQALRSAFSLTPAYLETDDTDVDHLMDQGLALGRRFRALKLWFVIRYFGAEGVRARIARHMELARGLRDAVAADPDWELWEPSHFSLVVLRFVGAGAGREATNGWNRQIMDAVNRTGVAFLSHTELDGDVWLRFAIGNIRTTEDDVIRAWEALRRAARQVGTEA